MKIGIKKAIFVLTSAALMMFLCACSGQQPEPEAKPVDYTIGEMSFTLDDTLTLSEDGADGEDAASDDENGQTDPSGVYASMYFSCDEFKLNAYCMLTAYHNSSLDKAIEEICGQTAADGAFTEVKAGDAAGKLGAFEESERDDAIHGLYILNDGLFYGFQIYDHEDSSAARELLKGIADSVSFDPQLMAGTKTAVCGDLTYEIPEKYAELDFEPSDGFHEEQWSATAGDSYVELGVMYFNEWEWGYDYYTISYILADELKDSEVVYGENKLGECMYVTGTDEAGYSHIMSIFRYNDACYCFNLFSENKMSEEDLQPFLDSIKAKES